MSARAAAGPGGHPWPAWFQDTVQHAQLLTNRTLRNYLLAHGDAERWPELVKATLLYGVLCLQRDFPGQAALPLDTLREACRALHAEAAVAAALPRIRSQFASLEAEVGGFLDENRAGDGAQEVRPATASRPEGKQPAAGPTSCGTAAAPAQRRTVRPPNSSSLRPSSTAAAAGAPAAPTAGPMLPSPPRPKQPIIYPDWWPGATGATAGRRPSGGAVAARRPPPRLAYSRPPTAPASVTQDDLPTAAFLLVPPRVSTGRGAAEAGSSGSSAQQAQQAQARRPPEARIKLQHVQRLEVQREVQRAREVRLEGAAADGWDGDDAAALGEADGRGGSPRYDPAAVARWMAHFGV